MARPQIEPAGVHAHRFILIVVRRFLSPLVLAVVASVLSGGGVAAAAARPPAGSTAVTTTVTTTGNLLVLLSRQRASTAAVRAAVARTGALAAGRSVPEIGLITVTPSAGDSLTALARRLRALPDVASVQVEHRYVPRGLPNDPALTATNPDSGTGQWTLAKEGFYDAWNITRGDGALVGVIDTGIDGTHPELRSKIALAVNQQGPSDNRGTAMTDEVGHGTHVASLACAATNNGIGLAGAGYNCKLLIEKSDFSDSSIAASIVDAANRHVDALNMSFGPASGGTPTPAPDSEVRALDYAAARKVVLVAAAADDLTTEQGDPANVVQPAGTGPTLTAGIGLDVTAADITGHRASFAGYGNEISLAAYGALEPDQTGFLGIGGPQPGIFGAFPANSTDLEALPSPCGCRTTFGGSNSYAYLQGTSMAAPQVTAAAAMMRNLNPDATLADALTTLKRTATRRAGVGWTSDVGWGILNADAALQAIRRVDRLAPVSKLTSPAVANRQRFVVRWSGQDQTRPELISSGIARYEVYVRTNGGWPRLIVRTTHHSLTFRGRDGFRYVFFCVAVDRAGNRERGSVNVTTRVARHAR
jgi:serine protease